jgi:hypothetical protein
MLLLTLMMLMSTPQLSALDFAPAQKGHAKQQDEEDGLFDKVCSVAPYVWIGAVTYYCYSAHQQIKEMRAHITDMHTEYDQKIQAARTEATRRADQVEANALAARNAAPGARQPASAAAAAAQRHNVNGPIAPAAQPQQLAPILRNETPGSDTEDWVKPTSENTQPPLPPAENNPNPNAAAPTPAATADKPAPSA